MLDLVVFYPCGLFNAKPCLDTRAHTHDLLF